MVTHTLNGIMDGDIIRLSHSPEMAIGQRVKVILIEESAEEADSLPPGEGIQRAFGAWQDYAAELDEFVDENRRLRKLDRKELAE